MLSLFNRFLSRMRSSHPVLGNRNLLVIILDFLEGEDLFQIVQVSFSLRTTVQSVPNLEITVLRFRMKQSNECIERLRTSSISTSASRNPGLAYKTLPNLPFITINKRVRSTPAVPLQNKKEPDQPDFNDKKWVKFVDYFHHYAKMKGFRLQKRRDFENEEDWLRYKGKFSELYGSYVNHVRYVRTEPTPLKEPPRSIYRSYSSLLNKINSHMRDALFQKKEEQECVQKYKASAIYFI